MLNEAASPEPTHNVPSEADRTVPIECEWPSEGMQSRLLEAFGHGPRVWLPSSTCSSSTAFEASTLTLSS